MTDRIKEQIIVTGKNVAIPLGIVLAVIIFIIVPLKDYIVSQSVVSDNRIRIEKLEKTQQSILDNQANFQLQIVQDLGLIKYQVNQLLEEKKK